MTDDQLAQMVNTWGINQILYPIENDPLLHPDDRELRKDFAGSHGFYQCVDYEDPYIVLRIRDIKFRILPDRYTVYPSPKYDFFESVVDPNHPNSETLIWSIGWHFKEEKHVYFVKMDGKIKSRRYFEEDLLSSE